MPRRSARLAAQQSGLNTGAANEGRDDDSEGLWCSCRRPQGDRFMIQCDKKGKNCYQWYHGNCVVVTPAEDRRLESQGDPFICPLCASVPSLPPFDLASAPEFSWGPSAISGPIFL